MATTQSLNLSPVNTQTSLPPYATSVKEQRRTSVGLNPSSPTGASIWNTIVRAVSGTTEGGSTTERNDRSQSRGRREELFASSGRGGAGNFVRSDSAARAAVVRVEDGDERGRIVEAQADRVTHAGRGGQGNIRSPSRDAGKDAADRAYEEEVIRKHREAHQGELLSGGRGGAGNIRGDKSRSRSRGPAITSGRGGAGNMLDADYVRHGQAELGKLEEEDRAQAGAKQQHPHVHSSGRGGQGNFVEDEAIQPTTTFVAPGTVTHGGRGGAGNITVV